ncbi:hypothetical protein [Mycobacterium sp. E796]|uniref:hypothetical protein n=1 Tax=Mycobacterium sp. E796 TaxID=1834151 RepID=UPI000A60F5E3|nr:hypothetical protein [Mycobacterium sp. E796]
MYWLNGKKRFSPEAMVEYIVELLAAALRSAATLDPTLGTAEALKSLRSRSAKGWC